MLGLVAEEKLGFFGTGVTLETARQAVEKMSGRAKKQVGRPNMTRQPDTALSSSPARVG